MCGGHRLPLHEVVSRLPDDIAMEYIKIDAQGFDFEVMKGALAAKDKIQVRTRACVRARREVVCSCALRSATNVVTMSYSDSRMYARLVLTHSCVPLGTAVQAVSLECMDVQDKSKLLYLGQPTQDEIKASLTAKGAPRSGRVTRRDRSFLHVVIASATAYERASKRQYSVSRGHSTRFLSFIGRT